MGAFDDVVLRFAALRVTGEATLLAKSRKVFTTCQNFVNIGLMPGVPNEGIPRRIKDPVSGDGQFNNAKVRSQVTAGSRYFLDEE